MNIVSSFISSATIGARGQDLPVNRGRRIFVHTTHGEPFFLHEEPRWTILCDVIVQHTTDRGHGEMLPRGRERITTR